MIYFAEDNSGKDLFYVDIEDCPDYGNLIETSLPDSIFQIPDVLTSVRLIFKSEYDSTIMLNLVTDLIFYLKTRKEYSDFYFQEIELKSNGKYNLEQKSVMKEVILNSELKINNPITMQSNPFLFRFICTELNLFNKSKHDLINQEIYNATILNTVEYWNQNEGERTLPVDFRKIKLKSEFEIVYLHVKYIGENPKEFYFTPCIRSLP